MADVSELFIAPVIIAILIMFIYALFALGAFSSQTLIRRKNVIPYFKQTNQHDTEQVPGYEIHNYFVETLRIVTRLSPMLGLIATMIPMGPALKSLADGNIQGISENLIIAFAAVIWGLVVSTLTFWPATVKKRWYADELINIRKIKEHQSKTTETETTPKLEGAA
jgi:hypothetical protein